MSDADKKLSGEHADYIPTGDEIALVKKHATTKRVPRIKISHGTSAKNSVTLSVDHPDETVGCVLLMEVLGTASTEFYDGIIGHLVNASATGGKPDERGINFMISVVKGVEPRDQMETMLAAQMAAVHMASMTFARRLAGAENIAQQDSAARAFNNLNRTYAAQMEALKRYRSTGEQKVTVQHQHVTVNDGGQAIVGTIEHPAGGTRSNSEEQPHAKQLTHAPGQTLPGALEALRPAMSRTGG